MYNDELIIDLTILNKTIISNQIANVSDLIFIPENVRFEEIQIDSFKIVWDKPNNIESFKIQISNNNFDSIITTINTNDNNYIFTNLQSNTDYEIRVFSMNELVISNYVEKEIKTLPFIPDTPTMNSVSGNTTTSLQANWSIVSGANNYIVEISIDNFVSVLSSQTTSNTYYEFTGLIASTEYKLRVRAIGDEESNNSNIITSYTLPISPTSSNATNITSTSFQANWILPSGITQVKLDVSIDNFATFIIDNLTVTGSSYNVTGLTASTNYKYRVRSIGIGFNSDNSSIQSLITGTGFISFPLSITGAWGTLGLNYGFIFNPVASGDFTDYSPYNRNVSFFGSGINPTWIQHNNQWGLDFSSSNNKGLSFVADSNLISNTENTFIIEFANLTDPSVPQGLFTVWISGGIAISTGGGSDTSKIFVNTTNDYGSNHQVKTNNSQIGTAIISYSIKCQSGAEDYVFVRNQTNQSLTGTAITDISSFRNINGIRAMIGNFYTDGNFMSNAQFRGVIKRFAIIKQKLTDAQIKEIHRLMGFTT